ncbi:MAG: helix-turn-helix domain-containing protein [Erysipelotrichaceae bacterium]|nr:helix-turn-helix domain-containing protein [Erysipelotrichaceae bacterium]
MRQAREFLKYQVNDKTPTGTEFSEYLNFYRGTVQNAIYFLQNNKAIGSVPKGHLGTIIEFHINL